MGQWAQIPRELGSITSAYKRYDLPGPFFSTPVPAGLVYIVIDVSAVNMGDSAIPMSKSDFVLQDADGRQWRPNYYFFDVELVTSIPPHGTITGAIYFLVPDLPFSGSYVFWAFMGDQLQLTEWRLPF
jgi:hypothetical protein